MIIRGTFKTLTGSRFGRILPAVPYSEIDPVVFSTATTGTNIEVPDDVAIMEVIAWGSAGRRRGNQSTSATTGQGGTCIAYVQVTPNETLNVRVGNTSNNGTGSAGSSAGLLPSSGRGGGYSGVFRGTTPLVVAGGGGGSSFNSISGLRIGQSGGCGGSQCGSQSAGGTHPTGGDGSFLQGGSGQGGGTTNAGGGGGGGGFYGGAGGGNSTQTVNSGGGGSHLCPSLPEIGNFPDQSGAWAPGKRLTQVGANQSIPGYISGRAVTSNPGLVIIRFLPATVDFSQ